MSARKSALTAVTTQLGADEVSQEGVLLTDVGQLAARHGLVSQSQVLTPCLLRFYLPDTHRWHNTHTHTHTPVSYTHLTLPTRSTV